MLDVLEQHSIDVIEGFDVAMRVRLDSHCNDPIVSFGFAVLGLVRFDHTDRARLDQAPDKSRFVHQHQSIERIAVFADCSRNGAEVERENRTVRQNAFKKIGFAFVIVGKLVAATFWRIDHDV